MWMMKTYFRPIWSCLNPIVRSSLQRLDEGGSVISDDCDGFVRHYCWNWTVKFGMKFVGLDIEGIYILKAGWGPAISRGLAPALVYTSAHRRWIDTPLVALHSSIHSYHKVPNETNPQSHHVHFHRENNSHGLIQKKLSDSYIGYHINSFDQK